MSQEDYKAKAEANARYVLSLGLKGFWARKVWLDRMEKDGYYVKMGKSGKVVISGQPLQPRVVVEGCKIVEVPKR